MPYTLIANTGGAGTTTGVTSPAIDTTGANLIVIAASSYQANPEPTLTDSKSNTWSGLTLQADAGSARIRLYYAFGPTVGSGHTFTLSSGGTSFPAIAVEAFAGSVASPFDAENGAGYHTELTASPGSVTPSQNAELVVTAIAFSLVNTCSIDGGFTISNQTNFNSGTTFGCAMAYLIQTTAAAAAPTWTMTDVNTNGGAVIAAFKAAAAGGGSPFIPSTRASRLAPILAQ